MANAHATKKADEKGYGTIDKAREAANEGADKAKAAASSFTRAAGEVASAAVEKVDDAAANAGGTLKSLAGTVRENTPNSGVMGAASDTVANALEQGGKYLEEQGLSGMAEDVTKMIRRNPMAAMLVGVAIGYLIARATTSRS